MKSLLLLFIAELAIKSSGQTTTDVSTVTPTTTSTKSFTTSSGMTDDTSTTAYTDTTPLPKLSCDGVVFEIDAVIVQVPAGVCSEDTGTMLRCGSFGHIEWVRFENNNCSGNPINTTSVSDIMEKNNVTRFVVTCCSGNYCDYAKIRSWNTSKCDDYNFYGLSFSESVKLIDGCEGGKNWGMSKYTSCSKSKLSEITYLPGHSCNDSFLSQRQIYSTGQCDEFDPNQQIQIVCGIAQDTCYDVTGNNYISIIIFGGSGFGLCILFIVLCCFWRNQRVRTAAKYVKFLAPVLKITNNENDTSLQINTKATVSMVHNDGSYY
eukprot:UN01787